VISIKQALEKKNNRKVVLGVLVTKIRRVSTRKGDMMAFLTVEDKSGSTDVVIFPKTYKEMRKVLEEGKPMLIVGRINIRNNEKNIVLQKAEYVDESKHGSNFKGVVFRIKPSHTAEEIKELREFIEKSEGNTPVKIIINNGKENSTKILNKSIAMDSETKRWLRKF
jgi:DNA polymerase-3 subunit alpha